MSVHKFRPAPHRAIYIMHSCKGWFCYVAGSKSAAPDTPTITPGSYPTFGQAMIAARALHRAVGLPIAGTVVERAARRWNRGKSCRVSGRVRRSKRRSR